MNVAKPKQKEHKLDKDSRVWGKEKLNGIRKNEVAYRVAKAH